MLDYEDCRLGLTQNPPHPGEFITGIYLEPNNISGRVLNGTSRVTPEMTLRLSKALGRSAEGWLAMQDANDHWVAQQHVDLQGVSKPHLGAA